MINAKVTGIDDILAEFAQLQDTKAIARMVNRDIAPPIERRLDTFASQVPPARDDTKFVWSFNRAANDRARRWWWANIREGNIPTDGSHYLRSGTIAESWETQISIAGDTILLDIFNPAPGSEYVYGSPTQTQVPGHASTGWPNYQELLAFIDVVRTETRIAWEQYVLSTMRGKR